MTVGLKVGSITDEIGTADFFHSFFSTISAHLEGGWGRQYPVLMTKLYQGKLSAEDAPAALDELDAVQAGLARLPPSAVVWDYDDQNKKPPWGSNIAPSITSLSNYFVTSTGRDLFDTLREALEALRDEGGIAHVVNY